MVKHLRPKKITKKTTFFFLLVFSCFGLSSFSLSGQAIQTYYLSTNTNATITACSGFIFDDGGLSANYSDSSDAWIEIFSAQSGFRVTVSGTIRLETGDTLIIYDGAGIGGTILFQGTSPSNGTALTIPNYTSSTGPLTIRFITDGSGNEQGLELMIHCVDPNNQIYYPPSDTANCIDFTNLMDTNVTCYSGVFSNPYQSIGVVSGRHTVFNNVNEIDQYTNGLLHCVCPGEVASVRLGDNSVGARAEAIMYEYFVDTSNYDILVLKYAAVLQNPGHGTTSDPRFMFQILNAANVEIDPTCGVADFRAGNNTVGWNAGTSGVLWKDWTSVGIDLSAYHNQTIRIRFTTYDCSPTGHFGYAYFSLSCKKRKISVETCGNVQQNTYTGPDGFNYRWYYGDDPSVTLSTNISYTAPVQLQSQTLYCDVSFIDNPSCSFTLYVNVSPRFPLADFAYSRMGCGNTISFNNTSKTSQDGVTPDGTGDASETAFWDFGNGTTSTAYTPPPVTYSGPGTYTIKMIAGLANNQCLDTIIKTITILPDTISVTGNAHICEGESTILSVDTGNYVYWNTGETTYSITVAPNSDHTYTVLASTGDGCYVRGSILVNVSPNYYSENEVILEDNQSYFFNGQWIHSTGIYYEHHQTIDGCDSTLKLTVHRRINNYATICSPEVYQFMGLNLSQTGIYTDSIRLPNGCDSVNRLYLTVNPTYFIQAVNSICDNQSFLWRDSLFENMASGTYMIYDSLQTAAGCDSIYFLRLIVRATTRVDVYDTICQGESVHFLAQNYTQEGVHTVTQVQPNGCDAIHQLHLKVHPSYFISDTVTICDAQTYNFRGRILSHSGIYHDSLQSVNGCDSIYQLVLRINPKYLFPDSAVICDNQPYLFRGHTLSQSGVYDDSLVSSNGCDSIYRLYLTVHPNYFIDESATICDNDSYVYHGRVITQPGIYYDSLLTNHGCDSIYRLHLIVHSTYFSQTNYTMCDNQSYLWRDTLIENLPAGIHHIYDSLQTISGCDSIFYLRITIKPTLRINVYDTICQGTSFRFLNQNYTQEGIYEVVQIQANGCDRIFQLNLKVHPSYLISDTIAICDDETYNFRGRILSHSGVYYDSLQTINGCDSIYRLVLQINPNYFFVDSATICDNQTYNFRGQILSQTGIYYDSLLTASGCDSVYQIELHVAQGYLMTDNATICDNQTYNFRGQLLTQPGIYFDSLLTASGCDSVYQMTLHVTQGYLMTDSATICDNQTYNFRGQTLSQPGIYFDSLLTASGCDSVYQMTLHVTQGYLMTDSATICDNQTYNFRGQILSQTGIYYDSLLTASGCDSVYQMTLHVAQGYLMTDSATICDNQTYNFRGQILTQPGIYYDSLLTASGCDSVYQMTLHVTQGYLMTDNATICNNQTYNFRGQILTQPGIYHDSLLTASGCDSVYRMELHVTQGYLMTDNATICDNQTYNFRGQILIQPGIYYDSLLTASGCDSVYQMTLHVTQGYLLADSATICNNQTYNFRGQTLLQPGIYYDSLLTASGCDSVYQMTLHVTQGYLMTDNATICNNQTYNFRGQTLSQPGIYYDSLLTASGCDSVYQMTLHVTQGYLMTDSATICDNQTYNFRGQILSQTGIYYDSLLTASGCDSVYQIELHVAQGYLMTDNATICNDQTYNFRGQILTQPGIYFDSLLTASGCDSVYRMELHVTQGYLLTDSATICDNQTYNFRGQILSQPGIYDDSLLTANGCDSVYRIEIYVTQGYLLTDSATICNNQTYNFRGQILSQPGIYFDSLLTASGCDSVYQMTLHVTQGYLMIDSATICNNQTYNFRGQTLSQPGIYFDSLLTASGCDSVYQMTLHVTQGYLMTDSATICNDQTYNFRGQTLSQPGIYFDSLLTASGCDSVYQMTLHVTQGYLLTDSATICNNQTYNFRGQTLSQPGIYFDSLLTVSGCDSVYQMTLHITQGYLLTDSATICDNQTYNFRGQILSQPGIYYDSLLTANGCDSVYRMEIHVAQGYLMTDSATICDNQIYNFRGQSLSQPGIYYDSLLTASGCDSVYQMTLHVTQGYLLADSATICNNQTYNFRGQTLLQPGIYYDSLLTVSGCDSVYQMTLHVTQGYLMTDSVTICNDQTYNFRGQILSQPGIYFDSLLTASGCDSVYRMELHVTQGYLLTDSATICNNQTYNFRGQILSQPGIYYDSLLTASGCDSVYQMTLHVTQGYLLADSATICDNQTYNFRGQLLTQPGIYYDSLLTASGCDSVYQMTLHVTQGYLMTDNATICNNQTYNFRGQTLSQPGIYYDSLLTASGCDSVYQMTLHVTQGYLLTDSATICNNQTYNFRGQILSQPGIYYDSLLTASGCDSVYRMTLHVNQTYLLTDSATICDNQTYNFRGQILSQLGIYFDSLLTASGCDSIYRMEIHVTQGYLMTDSATICNNQTYNFRGQILSQPGIYYDSLLTASGCDSVYQMTLHVKLTYLMTDSATICDNQTYNFRGQILTQPGIYYDSLFTASGCDSVYQMTLHVTQGYLLANSATICDNQTYNFRGQILSQPGIYFDSLLTASGCDSVYQMTIHVKPTYLMTDSATICDNQTYNFRGQILSQPGIYYDSLLTANGCDSVYRMTLHVNPIDTIYLFGSVCQGEMFVDSAEFFVIPEDSNLMTGQYEYTRVLTNPTGCDTPVILRLSVNPTYQRTIEDTICQGDSYTDNGFNLSPQDSNGYRAYELNLQTISGCDSTINLMLHIKRSYDLQYDTTICQGYPFNNFGFVLGEQEESGDYTYQLDFITQEGCDSIITLNLSVVDVNVSIDIFESDFCEEGSVMLVANTQLPDLLWSTGETTHSIIVQQSGRYFVTASFGTCSAEDAIVIEPCSLQLFIPAAFTPSNQDGLNDYFSIPLPKNHQIIEFEIVIYNRWGEAIFTSKDYNFKWDGKYKGKFIPNQVYPYRIIVVTKNGNDYLFKGTITVL